MWPRMYMSQMIQGESGDFQPETALHLSASNAAHTGDFDSEACTLVRTRSSAMLSHVFESLFTLVESAQRLCRNVQGIYI